MRDYAEIAHNLRCCGVGVPCDDCTYQDDIVKCGSLEGQAANAIEELLAESADLVGQVKRSQEEIRKLDKLLAAVPKWISVEDELPESVCKSYLCLTDTGYHCEVRWTNNVYGLWKSENKWGWSIADVPQYCKVTHWMPLPAPPKEDAE